MSTVVENIGVNVLTTLTSIPNILYKKSIEAATSISSKIKEYGDKTSDTSEGENDDAFILNSHVKYLDKLRMSNKEAYDSLLSMYNKILESGKPDSQAIHNFANVIESKLSFYTVAD